MFTDTHKAVRLRAFKRMKMSFTQVFRIIRATSALNMGSASFIAPKFRQVSNTKLSGFRC